METKKASPEITTKQQHLFRRAFCAFLAVLFFGLLVAGVTFSWGDVKYSRITFTYSNYGNNGEPAVYEGSAILYIPKTATIDNPAPAVLNIHGISSNAQSQSNYSIELARRGYVVMAVDLPSSGYTDMVGQAPPTKQDMTTFLDEAVKVLDNLNYVQKGNYTSFGFSGGVKKAYEIAARYKDKFNLVIGGSGAASNYSGTSKRTAYADMPEYDGLNKIGVESSQATVGMAPHVEGNPADGTYIADYYFPYYVTHVWMTIFSPSMSAVCKYINEVNPAPNMIDPDNLTYQWAHIFSVFGYLAVIVFLVTFAELLLSSKMFADLKKKEFPVYDVNEPKWLGPVITVLTMVLAVAAMLILVVKLQIVPLDTGIPAIPLWFNVYLPYFFALGIIDVCLFIFRFHLRHGKKQGGNLVAYGVLVEGGLVQNVIYIGKSLIVGLVTGGTLFSLLMFIEKQFGARFNFFDWALNVGPAKILVHSWFYILMYIFMFVCGNLNNFVAKADNSVSLKDNIKDITLKTVFGILPMLFLVGLNLGRGMGWIPGKTNVPMDHLYGYIFTIALATIVNNIITKKTKNVWVGATVCGVYLGFAVTFGFALQATMFG